MLFDPWEEQFHLPASPIKLSNGQSRHEEMVGEENESRVFLGVEVVNAPQRIGIPSSRFRPPEQDGLVGPQAGRTIHRSGETAVEWSILFGASDEKGARLGEDIEACEVEITPIEQIKGAGFGQKLIEEVDIVDLAAGHINTGWNAPPQVDQGMDFDDTFFPPEWGTGKQGQAQI